MKPQTNKTKMLINWGNYLRQLQIIILALIFINSVNELGDWWGGTIAGILGIILVLWFLILMNFDEVKE